MEAEPIVSDAESKKRKNSRELQQDDESIISSKLKKACMFSAKEFRKHLNSNQKLNALKSFLSALSCSSGHDYVYDYLKNGGNCLELLQTLESDSTIPPHIVFDLVTRLLLKINYASYAQYYSPALESCRYLINNYLPLVHKMLGLSSSKEERKACLKLLTAMAAFSPNLAKDILINVKFHSANIELMTKHTGETNSVRDCFIHFLTAFLVDSDIHTLSILLEKSGLLSGIIPGLQYDAADTVCIVVAAMKNHILENNCVTKTTKMHVFNTSVVKDIVNLYNWKGPAGLKTLEKNNKTVFEVDKIAKSKVSECVHDFLLVLCTSHKHGVIFRDPLIGLGRKNQNGLMYTVLDSLDRPWEHSYASELVIKICRSCPDLTKNLWSILKPFLEPRPTEKWINAMNFASKLIKEMEPECIEYSAKNLNPHQLAQIIEFLASPLPIIKVLNSDNINEQNFEIKLHISILLCDMLEKIDSYLHLVKNWTTVENYNKIKQLLSNYINKNYPNSQNLLDDWKLEEGSKKTAKEQAFKHTYLETILNILKQYKQISPQLLQNLSSSGLDLKELFLSLVATSEDEAEKLDALQVKVISIFVDIDHSYFLPKTDIFEYAMKLLLRIYHKEKGKEIQLVLYKLMKNSGLFDSSLYEINIWLNGIFNLSSLTESFVDNFVHIIRSTSENVLEYQKELSDIQIEENASGYNDTIMNTLLHIPNDIEDGGRRVKHRYCSPLIIGILKHLRDNFSKNMKKYSEFVLFNHFHCQTVLQKFLHIVKEYNEQVPSNILMYVQNWANGTCEPIAKTKENMEGFKIISEAYLGGTISEEILSRHLYPDFLIDVLRMCSFYFSNLVVFELVTKNHSRNWIFLIRFLQNRNILDDICLEIILENPNLINNFNIIQFGKGTSSSICTEALFEVFKDLQKVKNIDSYVKTYCGSIFRSLMKILKKPKKYLNNENITNMLEVFPLEYKDCIKVITEISELLSNNTSEITNNSTVLDLLTYCIDRVIGLHRSSPDLSPIDRKLINNISSYLVGLNKENLCGGTLSRVLKNYLEVFPHAIEYLDENLFTSILQLNEYSKDSADLCVFLLERNLTLTKDVKLNIHNILEKKGVLLPLIHVLVNANTANQILEEIYGKLENSILKAMQKPQKVGQHFLKNYDIFVLVERYMSLDKCRTFTDKVLKFEVAELFHVKLLEACFSKVLKEGEMTEKQVGSIILTFVHMEIALFKKFKGNKDDDIEKMSEISKIFSDFLENLLSKTSNRSFPQVSNNETFKTFCKFALKFGVAGHHVLLKIVNNLMVLSKDSILKDDAALLLEMLIFHSEFLSVVLGEHSDTKLEVLRLFLTVCQNWNELMEKNHLAIILSAYRGMVTRCDREVLALLKLYESKAEQTRFYDFKPFLWGRAAATHYSVRTRIESSLTTQPKISDVLGIINEDLVNLTITNYPLKESLYQEGSPLSEDYQCYDLRFLLPLFSHILAPEQQVKTYIFSRSGALSLTIAGLSSQDKEVRQAACHVLSRFHFHLEARQTGKDNLLWIRFVEALCKGAAVLPNFKLNNFASIFYARMALILTNPKHVMYTPLSSYLTAKQDLDLSTVPELYTLIFSSDVNYKEHRHFILEILRDGLRTEKDFVDFLKSMAPKLFLELFSSCVADVESQMLILDILLVAVKVPFGVKILCENYSLLSYLHGITSSKVLCDKKNSLSTILPKLLPIYLYIVKIRHDFYTNQLIFDIFNDILRTGSFSFLKENDVECYYEVLYNVFTNNSTIFEAKDLFFNLLLESANDKFCNYIRSYGCKFINENSFDLQKSSKNYFLRLLMYKLLLKDI